MTPRFCVLHPSRASLIVGVSHEELARTIVSLTLPFCNIVVPLSLAFLLVSVSHEELARTIDLLPRLRMIALRNNPCMTPYTSARAAVLALSLRIRQPSDCFVVLDTEITPADRLDALSASGAPEVCRGRLLRRTLYNP